MNVANPLPWLFIFILILAVVGAVAAIIWRSWIVGSILLVFVGLFFGLYPANRAASLRPIEALRHE